MSVSELAKRIDALEQKVAEVQAQVDAGSAAAPDPRRPWWREDAGRFANDPGFEEIVRLGREYRESLRPKVRRRGRSK